MLLDKRELFGKKNQIAVGYDLNYEYAQISYAFIGSEPETLPVVAGTEQYNIPLVLCKRHEVNQWFFGREALRNAKDGEGVLVEGLLEKAEAGEAVEVDGEEFRPEALLALFVKRSLSLLGMTAGLEQIGAFMITVDGLDSRAVEVFSEAVEALQLKTEQIYFQSHMESFYYYNIHQPKELWQYQTAVCDFSGRILKTYRMECNKRTVPIVAFIEEKEYPEIDREEQRYEQWDMSLLEAARELTEGKLLSTVYLIGEGFHDDWCKESLKVLCKNRRVFMGNNLFSKGACYAACTKIQEEEINQEYVFLGNDKLKTNIGMKVLRRGEESYFALLDAGINWYEAKKECEFILESGNSFSLVITPLTGDESRELEMVLDGLPVRENKTTRLSFSIKLLSEKLAHLEIEDMGFGEIVSASHRKWIEEFEV